MKQIKAMLMVAAVMAMVMSLFAAPASAAGQGEVAFTGTASLPDFPSPGNTGTFSGTASGKLQGVGNSGPYAVVYANATMTASFNYNEPAATCPALGTANGSFTISGASVGTDSTVTIKGNFSWNRAGATAVITLSNVSVTLNGTLEDSGGSGAATAAFESPNAVTNCLAGGGPLTATVAGSGTVADA